MHRASIFDVHSAQTRTISRYIINGSTDDISPAILRAACKLHPLLRAALEVENRQDLDDLGDLEEGQTLVYPPSPSWHTAGPSDGTSPPSSPLSSAPSSPCQPPHERSSVATGPTLGLDPDPLSLGAALNPSPPGTSTFTKSAVEVQYDTALPGKRRRHAKSEAQSSVATPPALHLELDTFQPADSLPGSSNRVTQCGKKKLGPAAIRKARRAQAELRKSQSTNAVPLYKIRSQFANRTRADKAIKNTFNAKNLPAAKGAYIGLRRQVVRRYYTLEELLDQGYGLIEWDGW